MKVDKEKQCDRSNRRCIGSAASLKAKHCLRGRVIVAANATEEVIKAAALADPHVQKFVGDKAVRKVIIVPGKLVNIVV